MIDLVHILCGAGGCDRLLLTVQPGARHEVVIGADPRNGDSAPNRTALVIDDGAGINELDDHILLRCDRHGARQVDGQKIRGCIRLFAVQRKTQFLLAGSIHQ